MRRNLLRLRDGLVHWQAGRTLRRLDADPDPQAMGLAQAWRSRGTPATPDLEAIEGLRRQLAGSQDILWPDAAPAKATLGYAARVASKGPAEAAFLHHLVLALQPRELLELGTLLGISAMYIGAGLRRNGAGHLLTVDGNAVAADIARKNLRAVGLADWVTVVTGRFHEHAAARLARDPPLDLVFKDGHHTFEATVDWFEQSRPHMSDGAVFVFDDIRWSKDMARAWRQIRRGPGISVAVDAGELGVVVTRDGAQRARHYVLA